MRKKRTEKIKQPSIACALTVAGSDSGGGAGIQADLKTFSTLQVHGTSVITCITAQNPKGVLGIQPVSSKLITQQFEALNDGLQPYAMKTGMLFSAPIVKAVIRGIHLVRPKWFVLDPVMVATSGVSLLEDRCLQVIKKQLLPLAGLVTPNIPEAEVLLKRSIDASFKAKDAVKALVDIYETPFLLKGGHLPSGRKAIDYLYDGQQLSVLESEYIPARETHGTGCTMAAATTAYLAKGQPLQTAAEKAKRLIADSIRNAYRVGDYEALNPWNASET